MPAPTLTGTQSVGHTSGSQASLTVSHTSNGNPLLVIATTYASGLVNYGTCTFNSVSMKPILRAASAASTYGWQVFYLAAPTTGTFNVVFTPVTATWLALGAYNLSSFGGYRTEYSNAASATSISRNIESISTDELILDVVASDAANQNFTEGAGQTLIFEETVATGDARIASSTEPGAVGTVTMSWTLSVANNISQIVLALVGAGSAGGGEHSGVF